MPIDELNKLIDELTKRYGVRDVVIHITEPKAPVEEAFKDVFSGVEVDESPKFVGGDKGMYEWLYKHKRYPASAQEKGIEGRVTMHFVVEKDGSIGPVKIARSSKDKDLDAEATRLTKAMPKFIPAKKNGQPVRCWYTLPISFKLPK